MNQRRRRLEGQPQTAAAPELVDSGFALEIEDAVYLHDGLNLADIAQVLDLRRRGLTPEHAVRALLALLLEVHKMPAAEFPYDPRHGEPYNSREFYFAQRVGTSAGWLHAGRPRREAARIALRLHLRRQLAELVGEAASFVATGADKAEQHDRTLMPDQTYLQQAQPSTFGHYLLSFVYPTVRDAHRLLRVVDEINGSPGGAGCVNGTRLLDDRTFIAEALGFGHVIEHTRDAMWQVDGLIHVLATTASLLSNYSKLAEDLEIFSSAEFDFVDLDDGFTRASVLMPQKRNPYSLSIVRGASGVLLGRLAGFLAVTKSPSARSDSWIFANGEVPRALDLALRISRLITGVVRTLRVNSERMREELDAGYTQATDLAEHLTRTYGVDYRTAYVVVGKAVRAASLAGLPGIRITGEMIDEAAAEHSGARWDVDGDDLTDVLDPEQIVATRTAQGGAAPAPFARMVSALRAQSEQLRATADRHAAAFDRAEADLLAAARAVVAGDDVDRATPPRPTGGAPR